MSAHDPRASSARAAQRVPVSGASSGHYRFVEEPARDGGLVTMPDIMRQVMDAISAVGDRVGTLEQKIDKLPETYVQRRELDTLVEAQRTAASRIDKFDEWRMSMIERLYTNTLQMTQRSDDHELADAHRELRSANKRDESTSDRKFTLSIAQAGWAVAILVALLGFASAHASLVFH